MQRCAANRTCFRRYCYGPLRGWPTAWEDVILQEEVAYITRGMCVANAQKQTNCFFNLVHPAERHDWVKNMARQVRAVASTLFFSSKGPLTC
jgi:hypothetical protein